MNTFSHKTGLVLVRKRLLYATGVNFPLFGGWPGAADGWLVGAGCLDSIIHKSRCKVDLNNVVDEQREFAAP